MPQESQGMACCLPVTFLLHLNLNGQIDNTSPGGGAGGECGPEKKLVPGSHKRCELGHTVIRHFSRGDKKIREVIPVPVSLWKETTFVHFLAEGICKAKECWFLQRLFFGIRISVGILALPFRPLHEMQFSVFLLFLIYVKIDKIIKLIKLYLK